ncbi:hypothetical protein D9M70_553700 [compost metagenome]
MQRLETRFGQCRRARLQGQVHRAARRTGQRDQSVRTVFGKPGARDPSRLAALAAEIGTAHQIHEPGVTIIGRGDQDDRGQLREMLRVAAPFAIRLVFHVDGKLAAGNRLQSVVGCFLRKLERGKEIVGVGDPDRRLIIGNRLADDLLQRQRTFEQGEGRVDAQMHKLRVRTKRLARCCFAVVCHYSHPDSCLVGRISRLSPDMSSFT